MTCHLRNKCFVIDILSIILFACLKTVLKHNKFIYKIHNVVLFLLPERFSLLSLSNTCMSVMLHCLCVCGIWALLTRYAVRKSVTSEEFVYCKNTHKFPPKSSLLSHSRKLPREVVDSLQLQLQNRFSTVSQLVCSV